MLSDASCLERYGQAVPLGWFKFHSIVKEMVKRPAYRVLLEPRRGAPTSAQGGGAVGYGRLLDQPATEIKRMLQEFHDVGFLMWHDRPGTRDLVVLDAQWMIDRMTSFVAARSKSSTTLL